VAVDLSPPALDHTVALMVMRGDRNMLDTEQVENLLNKVRRVVRTLIRAQFVHPTENLNPLRECEARVSRCDATRRDTHTNTREVTYHAVEVDIAERVRREGAEDVG
jgi:hypothetical protein